jgi:cytidyltransferase-like protein
MYHIVFKTKPRAALSILWTIAFLFLASGGIAAPLTDSQVQSAKRILIMPGTFDPITKGHIAAAQAALKASKSDLVIILPTSQTFHKEPYPFEARVRLIDAALKYDSQIFYPSKGTWRDLAQNATSFDVAFYKKLRKINPQVTVSLVVGQDVAEKTLSYVLLASGADEIFVVSREVTEGASIKVSPTLIGKKVRFIEGDLDGISSSAVRSFLQKHLELYFGDGDADITSTRQALSKLVPAEVAEMILNQGLYLSVNKNNKKSAFAFFKKWLRRKATALLVNLGYYENFKEVLVSASARPNLSEVVINGKAYPVQKYLGGGTTADVYLIHWDGKDVAVKLAKNENAQDSILQTVPIHMWAKNKLNGPIPEIYAYDPDGRWMISEFVAGESLKSYLENHSGIPEALNRELLAMHAGVLQMSQESYIGIDFAADNIVVRDGKPFLVDLGPVPRDQRLLSDGRETIARWQNKFTPENNRPLRCEAVFF